MQKLLPAVAVLAIAPSAFAVVQASDADRLTLPADYSQGGSFEGVDYLPDSGYDWTVSAGQFAGTAIAENWVLTAAHTGTGVGSTVVTTGGQTFSIIDAVDHAGSDLRLLQVDGNLPSWAPLYRSQTHGNETNRNAVLYGRGVDKGAEVRVNGELKGWEWGGNAGPMTWGENRVESILNAGPGAGQVLAFDFDRPGNNTVGGTRNEGGVMNADSGGGLFVEVNGDYYLAGVHLSVEGAWGYTSDPNDGTFLGAIFDTGGLYRHNSAGSTFISDTAADKPYFSYSTRVSSNLNWIEGVVGANNVSYTPVPEPASAGLLALGAIAALRRSRPQRG